VRLEERPLNEHAILNGTAGCLHEPFDHDDRKPLSDWVAKHNRYAGLEAEEFFKETLAGGYDSSIRARFRGSQAERKRWVKLKIWNRLPLLLRPFLFSFGISFSSLASWTGVPGSSTTSSGASGIRFWSAPGYLRRGPEARGRKPRVAHTFRRLECLRHVRDIEWRHAEAEAFMAGRR